MLTFIAAIALLATLSPATAEAKDNAWTRIVVFKDTVDADAKTAEKAARHGLQIDHAYKFALKGFAAKLNAKALAELSADPDVAFISDDREVSVEGSVALQPGDSAPTGVRRVGAASATSVREASTISVAVLDTGISLAHPDLNAVNGKNCVRKNRTANDDNGHGTHVSGTIAARNNGSGVVGMAPGTRVYAVKVLNSSGSGTWSQVICGIDWVTANAAALNIKVASMSLSGGGANDNNCGSSNADALHRAICNSTAAGVTYVVAAGNSGTNLDNYVPAAYPEALTVTAASDSDGVEGGVGGAPSCRPSERDDTYATFSNYAATSVAASHTIAAPGVCIASTWLSGSYNTISGTSMATPHASGAVALCFGEAGSPGPCTGLTAAQVVQKLRGDAQAHATAANGFVGDPLHPVGTRYYGYLLSAGN